MRTVRCSPSLALALVGALAAPAFAQDPIKIGVLEDQSGDFAAATHGQGARASSWRPKRSTPPAASPGGKIELVVYDTQSDNTRYQEFMRRVLQRDKVDVVFAGFSRASREAYRPIVNQFDGLAFYNNQYEGGVCDANMIVTGAVPEQQFSTLIPWMMEKYGKKVYTIAADYNFGQISAEWVRQIVKENGGEMVGEEFIPLGVSQFSPDHPEHPEGQAGRADDAARRHGAGLLLRAGGGREPRRCRWAARSMSARATSTSASPRPASPTCMSRPTTSKRSTRRRARHSSTKWRAKFPNEPYINQEAENSYHRDLPLQADGRAGRFDRPRDDPRACIAKGDVCVDAPRRQGLHRPEEPARCPTRSIWPRSAPIIRSPSPRSGTTSSRTGWAMPAAT